MVVLTRAICSIRFVYLGTKVSWLVQFSARTVLPDAKEEAEKTETDEDTGCNSAGGDEVGGQSICKDEESYLECEGREVCHEAEEPVPRSVYHLLSMTAAIPDGSEPAHLYPGRIAGENFLGQHGVERGEEGNDRTEQKEGVEGDDGVRPTRLRKSSGCDISKRGAGDNLEGGVLGFAPNANNEKYCGGGEQGALLLPEKQVSPTIVECGWGKSLTKRTVMFKS